MNVFDACVRLGIWSQIKVGVEVWAFSKSAYDNAHLLTMKSIAKVAFKDLAMDHHPDRGGDPKIFLDIKSAYDIIIKSEFSDFVIALDNGKKSELVYFKSGSDQCNNCDKWGKLVDTCITMTCSGFEERKKINPIEIRGRTRFAAILDDGWR